MAIRPSAYVVARWVFMSKTAHLESSSWRRSIIARKLGWNLEKAATASALLPGAVNFSLLGQSLGSVTKATTFKRMLPVTGNAGELCKFIEFIIVVLWGWLGNVVRTNIMSIMTNVYMPTESLLVTENGFGFFHRNEAAEGVFMSILRI
jgi:hypothetical protein